MNPWIQTLLANIVIASFLAILATVARQRSARGLSYVLWILVLVKLVTPTVYHIPLPFDSGRARIEDQSTASGSLNDKQPENTRTLSSVPTISGDIEGISVGIPAAEKALTTLGRRTDRYHVEWKGIALAFWFAGSVFYLFLTVYRLYSFRRLVGQASIDSPELSRQAAQILGLTGRVAAPRVIVVEAQIPPMLWPGVFRPTVYLPSQLIRRLSDAERTDLLAHEMTHFRRRDPWRRWFETAVTAIYWWLPITWWARRELEGLEDECCDSTVLDRPDTSPKRYAQLLLKTVDFLSASSWAHPKTACSFGRYTSKTSHVEIRIRKILSKTRSQSMSREQWTVIAAIIVVVCPVSGVSFPGNSPEEISLDERPLADLGAENSRTKSSLDAESAQPIAPGPKARQPSFAWDRHSDFQRVPKSALGDLGLNIVTVDSINTLDFVLTRRFVALVHLTPDEERVVNSEVARAVHEYRMLERANLRPTSKLPPAFRRRARQEGVVTTSVSFELIPFREEAAALRDRLAIKLRALIGRTRAQMILDVVAKRGELRMMRPVRSRRSDAAPRSFQFVYQFEDANPPSVRLSRFSGSGGGGLALGPARDQYAPAEVQPILKKWRATVAERIGHEGLDLGEIPESEWDLPSVEWPKRSSSSWNEDAPYVDVDKWLLAYLSVPAQDPRGFSPTAAVLLGLSSKQEKAILALHELLGARFCEIQYNHFRDIDPEKGRYVIRAFPEEAAELDREWRDGLNDIVGPQRVGSLDKYMRTGFHRFDMTKLGREDVELFLRFLDGRTDRVQWLGWGKIDIEIEFDLIEEGQGRKRFEVKYNTDNGGPASASGSLAHGLPIRIRDPLNRRFQQADPTSLF